MGDPAQLVADISVAKEVLHWQPKNSDLMQIVQDAWQSFART
jgi:UDP-glucose 4-epimerase